MERLTHHIVLVAVAAISLGLRLHQIHSPDHVCWDEVHFGKYASYYINKTLFFDVHPPLGKVMLAFSGYITGYDGKFQFNKPGDSLEHVQYVGMRQASAVFGAALVPLSAAIVWELSASLTAVILTSVLVMSDTALTVVSRFILLDSFLLFFIFLSCYLYIKHLKCREFSRVWWLHLCGCGASLACALGVKFVGLFVTAHIGLCVVRELWAIVNRKEIPLEKVVQHIMAKIYTLICIPIFVYCLIYVVHFVLLCKSGVGDGFYSSAFQSTLSENPLYHTSLPQYLAYGSEITLRNYRPSGGYLHSHPLMYPREVGSSIQQVTTYSARDKNNFWIIKAAGNDVWSNDDSPVVFVKDGDFVRLQHKQTGRYLHSDSKPAPLTAFHGYVGGHTSSEGDEESDNVFQVRVVHGHQDEERITPIYTVLQFVHRNQHCALESKGKQLPAWGMEQIEVSCNPDLSLTSSAQWNVEELQDGRLPNVRLDWKQSRPGFLSKFIETHVVMMANNRNLRPKADVEFVSRPWMWPIAYRGQLFSVHPHILMLGNPATHWVILALALPTLVVFIIDMVKLQRAKAYSKELTSGEMEIKRVYGSLGFLVSGYALHYLPFYPMTRVLYAHHYLPAYVYSAMFTGMSVDHLLQRISARGICGRALACCLVIAISALSIASFYVLSPIVYGYDADAEDSPMAYYKWNQYWDF